MPRSRLLQALALLIALGAVTFLMISLVMPSPRRLVLGVDRRTGAVRPVGNEIALLPPHQFFILAFDQRSDLGGLAQYDGAARVPSREGILVTIDYRLRFRLQGTRIPDYQGLIRSGWSAWIRDRVTEAVGGVTRRIPIDALSSPASGEYDSQRDEIRQAVTAHLARFGFHAAAFEIARLDIDQSAVLRSGRQTPPTAAQGTPPAGVSLMPANASQPESRQTAAMNRERQSACAWYNNQAADLRSKRKLEDAERSLRKAIELDPGAPVPYRNLAVVLMDREEYAAADDALLQAIARGLTDPERHLSDFVARYRLRNMPSRAVALLTKGKEIFPQSPLIAADLGASLAAAGRDSEALPELDRSLSLQPSSTRTLNNLGLLHARRNDFGRALDCWNRSLAIDPQQPRIQEAVRAARSRL